MKLHKALFAGLLLTGLSHAATVDIVGSFTGGVELTVSGSPDTYIMAIGGYEAATFTQFGTQTDARLAGDDLIGSFVGVAPTSLNNDTIFIFVGTGPDIATSIASGGYAILQTTGNFPSDVSSALASSSAVFTGSGDVTIVESSAGTSFTDSTTLNLVPVPEPSIALLGALGVLGLIRRRR